MPNSPKVQLAAPRSGTTSSEKHPTAAGKARCACVASHRHQRPPGSPARALRAAGARHARPPLRREARAHSCTRASAAGRGHTAEPQIDASSSPNCERRGRAAPPPHQPRHCSRKPPRAAPSARENRGRSRVASAHGTATHAVATGSHTSSPGRPQASTAGQSRARRAMRAAGAGTGATRLKDPSRPGHMSRRSIEHPQQKSQRRNRNEC